MTAPRQNFAARSGNEKNFTPRLDFLVLEDEKMSLASIELNDGALHMQINTPYGEQEIDPESLITFPEGLPGFEDLKQFKLFHEEGKSTVFYLQSIDDAQVQFPLVDPDNFQVNYQITLSDDELALLKLDNPEDATILVTVSRADGAEDGGIHANFMGPIVINTSNKVAIQKTLNNIKGSVIIKAE